jgi:hypothetical protein
LISSKDVLAQCVAVQGSAREEETAQPLSGNGHLLFAEVPLAPGFLGWGESDENRTSFLQLKALKIAVS